MKGMKIMLILVLPSLVFARTLEKNVNSANIFSRFLQKTQFFEVAGDKVSAMNCTKQNHCVPDGLQNVSEAFVSCQSGKCVCHECFIKDISTGKCYTCTDYMYSETKHTCGTDSRPRQLTAFLLSFFLSYIGAANIYIEQYSLAVGQHILLFLASAILCFMCCIPLYLACCISDVRDSVTFIAMTSVAAFLELLVLTAMFAWWLADVIIFATNKRLSGNKCVLKHM